MPEPTSAPRFTLRALPLPAKMVVTLFMLTVGLGYSSALVQMHFQHTQGDGSPMPGEKDVIEIFAGKRWVTAEEAKTLRPKSRLELMATGARDSWGGTSMAPAFFHKDPSGSYKELTEQDGMKVPPDVKAKVDADREGEQKIVQLWCMLSDKARAKAYEDDKFEPKAADAPAAITKEFLHGDTAVNGVKVRTLLTTRCAGCHKDGREKSEFPLTTYQEISEYLVVPEGITVPEGADGAWCVSSRQISREKLAQSTHAHLLSFAMLFTLTGFVFSFTSYPSCIRFFLAPIVLLSQVADVSCWWLARIDGPGIHFAKAIMITGGIVGCGLALQIVLSVFNMYGAKGKVVLAAIFLGAAAGGGFIAKEYGKPFLEAEKEKKLQADADAQKKGETDKSKKPKPAVELKGKNGPKPPMKDPMMSPSKLERLLAGEFDPKAPFGGNENGGMIRAFFDKDDEFKKQSPPPPELFEKRKSEQAALLAWVQTEDAKRKAAYESDKFPLPESLKGRLFTQEFKSNDVHVRIKTLIDTRCGRCHAEGKKGGAADYPLEKYEDFAEYFKPETAEK